MKQAASMKELVVPLLLPGIKINTSSTDFYPTQAVRLARFNGETWALFGDVLASQSSQRLRARADATSQSHHRDVPPGCDGEFDGDVPKS